MKLFTHTGLLLIVIILMTLLKSSRTAISEDLSTNDSDQENLETQEEERRSYDFNKLRRFLLTANAEQRAAKREKQEFLKRELIREYLQSISDSNTDRFQEVKKRFKTYCNSYEDLMNSNWATCG